METENVPTRESSLQATSKEHREQAIKEKLKTKVGRRYDRNSRPRWAGVVIEIQDQGMHGSS